MPERLYAQNDTAAPADLAVESEPEWLQKGGDWRNPPAGKAATSAPAVSSAPARRRSGSVNVRIVRPTEYAHIDTPDFEYSPWTTDLSSKQKHVLDQIATMMKEQPDAVPKLLIEAYSDNSGDPAINEALTIARANVVKAYLISQGIGVHRLDAKGLGEANPVAPNDTVAGRAENRRVEFKIVK
jgi:outer membrane protein OmpA-like peptidoglycan-associated protein